MSKSSQKLREVIEKAIEDLELTQAEYDNIISVAMEDGVIDSQERTLLAQLEDMIENDQIKIVP